MTQPLPFQPQLQPRPPPQPSQVFSKANTQIIMVQLSSADNTADNKEVSRYKVWPPRPPRGRHSPGVWSLCLQPRVGGAGDPVWQGPGQRRGERREAELRQHRPRLQASVVTNYSNYSHIQRVRTIVVFNIQTIQTVTYEKDYIWYIWTFLKNWIWLVFIQ